MEKKLFIKTVMETKASKEENRVVEFIVSKEISDRGGDVVKIKGMNLKNFKTNPVIMFGHKHSDLPVGKAISMRKTGDELRMKIEFAKPEEYQFADTVFKLVKGNYLNATSIGIIPDYQSMEYPEKTKLNGKSIRRIINKSELFEVSIVPIPMNQSALRVSKAFEEGIIDDKEFKEFQKLSKEMDTNLEHINDKEEIINLKSKVAELELLVKEQDMEAEEDSIYKDLFDEFTEEKRVDDDVIKELYDTFIELDKQDKDFKILDEYLK